MAREKDLGGSARLVSTWNGWQSAWRLLALLATLASFGCASGAPTSGEDVGVGVEQGAATASCSQVPTDVVGVGDGCDCPADGSTSCDPDCQVSNPGGA